jgi:hypothetical protein
MKFIHNMWPKYSSIEFPKKKHNIQLQIIGILKMLFMQADAPDQDSRGPVCLVQTLHTQVKAYLPLLVKW